MTFEDLACDTLDSLEQDLLAAKARIEELDAENERLRAAISDAYDELWRTTGDR